MTRLRQGHSSRESRCTSSTAGRQRLLACRSPAPGDECSRCPHLRGVPILAGELPDFPILSGESPNSPNALGELPDFSHRRLGGFSGGLVRGGHGESFSVCSVPPEPCLASKNFSAPSCRSPISQLGHRASGRVARAVGVLSSSSSTAC